MRLKEAVVASLVVQTRAIETEAVPESTGTSLHGWLLNLVKAKNEKVATVWHNSQSPKPFSLSPLFGRFAKTSFGYLAVKDQPYWFKLGLIGQEAFDLVANELFAQQAKNEILTVGNIRLRVEEIKLSGHPWANFLSLKELKNNHLENTQITLQFKTPTTFRRFNFNFVLPEPKLVFGSLLNKWQLLSSNTFELDLDKINEMLKITYFNIRTQFFPLKNQNLVGFTGKVAYEPTSRCSTKQFAHLASLANLALFAGIGQKTTMGMGVSRLI